jgi:phospholipase/carboxylesterase
MYSHLKQVLTAGVPAAQAQGALIMIHGRGGSARDIIGLANELNVADMAIYAPQATNNSWYPYSFMAPSEQNQPALDSALEVIGNLVEQVIADGIPAEKINFLGFSQGACLALEFTARNARRYGGIVAFTGGLIGEGLNSDRYMAGGFNSTPVLISTGNPDPHVPLGRVEESVDVFESLGAQITLKVYPGRPHTITRQEIDLANELIFNQK